MRPKTTYWTGQIGLKMRVYSGSVSTYSVFVETFWRHNLPGRNSNYFNRIDRRKTGGTASIYPQSKITNLTITQERKKTDIIGECQPCYWSRHPGLLCTRTRHFGEERGTRLLFPHNPSHNNSTSRSLMKVIARCHSHSTWWKAQKPCRRWPY